MTDEKLGVYSLSASSSVTAVVLLLTQVMKDDMSENH